MRFSDSHYITDYFWFCFKKVGDIFGGYCGASFWGLGVDGFWLVCWLWVCGGVVLAWLGLLSIYKN